VELLVVMTIIAILFALTAAAVVRAMVKMDEGRTRNDISQLQVGVQAFKTDFGISYIPDTLYLPPGADPTKQSVQYMTSVWSRIYNVNTGVDRISDNPINRQYWGTGNAAVKLQGYQTLVFFLGGARDATGNPIGFSTDAASPMSQAGLTGASSRKGPYFDFPISRLQVLPNDKTANNPFPAFIDVYGTTPYLYFSASKAGNDYNVTYSTSIPGPQVGQSLAGSSFSVVPFQISSTRFANANGFQIIGAGKDGLFGNGGTNWAGYPGGTTSMQGYDDVSNFHQTLLGIPAN
jgi:type II secretory pathway pseudopilin PulG